jgi:hypothetical protein
MGFAPEWLLQMGAEFLHHAEREAENALLFPAKNAIKGNEKSLTA